VTGNVNINREREFLVKRIAIKEEQLTKVEAELEETDNLDKESKLEKKAKRLLNEIKELYAELSELDKINVSPNVRHLSLDKSFQKIDFVEAKEIAKSINTKLGDSSGVVLLFLQRSTKQKGSYCLNEVLDLIVSDRKVGDDIIGDFRPYPVDLGSPISEFNETEFSKRLASHLNSDSEKCLSEIIKKLCLSLRGGSTVYIRVENWDSVTDPQKFLDWFIEAFWQLLVDELVPIFQDFSGIRLIVALIAKTKVFPDPSSLPPYFCTEERFDPCKVIELPLPDWEKKDIKNWLIGFRGLSNVESDKIASRIHLESEGTPDTICSILERDYNLCHRLND
jgi:Effector-associated domain 9